MAAKSYRKPLIGYFGKLMGSIPVERPHDLAKTGKGKMIFVKGNRIRVLKLKRKINLLL